MVLPAAELSSVAERLIARKPVVDLYVGSVPCRFFLFLICRPNFFGDCSLDSSRASPRYGGAFMPLRNLLRSAFVFAAFASISQASLAFTLKDSEGKTWR